MKATIAIVGLRKSWLKLQQSQRASAPPHRATAILKKPAVERVAYSRSRTAIAAQPSFPEEMYGSPQ